MKYSIDIVQVRARSVEVVADNEEDAYKKAQGIYEEGLDMDENEPDVQYDIYDTEEECS